MLIDEFIQTDLSNEDFEKIMRLRYHMSDKCTQTESPANIIKTFTQRITEGDGVGVCRPCFVSLDRLKCNEKWQYSCTQRSRSVSTNSDETNNERIERFVEEPEIRTRGESLNYNNFKSHYCGNKYSSTKATELEEFCPEEKPLSYIPAEENFCGSEEGNTLHIYDEPSQKNEILCKEEEDSDKSFVETSNEENFCDEKTDKYSTTKDDCDFEQVEQQNNYQCRLCGKKLYSNWGLKRHFEKLHKNRALESGSKRKKKVYNCSLCSSKYSCEMSLKRHVQLCHVQELKNDSDIRVYEYYKDVSCPLCCKKLYSKWSLKIHLKRNHANGCNQCSLRFTSEKLLSLHTEMHHSHAKPSNCETERHCQCLICGKKLHSYWSLHRHMRTKHEIEISIKELKRRERTFKCDHCCRSFFCEESLKQHVHSCVKTNETKANNRARERSYKCEQCSSKFSSENLLQQHVRTHHKTILVEKSDHRSSRNSFMHERSRGSCEPLKMHHHSSVKTNETKVNTPARSYPCRICGENLYSPWGLKRHLEKVHENQSLESELEKRERLHKCDQCSSKFSSEKSLEQHIQVQHRMNVENRDGQSSKDVDLHGRSSKRPNGSIDAHKPNESNQNNTYDKADVCQLSDHDDGNDSIERGTDHNYGEKSSPFQDNNSSVYLGDDVGNNTDSVSSNCVIQEKIPNATTGEGRRIREKTRRNPNCKICQKKLCSDFSLARHLKLMHPETSETGNATRSEKKFKCRWCGLVLSTQQSLTAHVRRKHAAEKRFVCNECGERFSSKHKLCRHALLIHNRKAEIRSSTDEAAADKAVSLADQGPEIQDDEMAGSTGSSRELNSDKKKPYVCDVCRKDFTILRSFKSHLQSHHTEGRFLMDFSEMDKKESVVSQVVKSQEQDATASVLGLEIDDSLKDEPPHICSVCKKEFMDWAAFRRHVKLHTEGKPYACGLCSKSYQSNWYLARHMKVHPDAKYEYRYIGRDKKKKPYICDRCSRQFSGKTCLMNHIKSHTGEKTYLCDQCSKQFVGPGPLRLHLFRAHSIGESYSCTVCDKHFVALAYLKRHVSMHRTEAKLYHCDKCGECVRDIKHHMKLHDSDKQFECDQCHKRFVSASYVDEHKLTHRKEKPFFCSNCQKYYKTSKTFQRHSNVCTGGKLFACCYCEKVFTLLCVLNRHKRQRHSSEMQAVGV